MSKGWGALVKDPELTPEEVRGARQERGGPLEPENHGFPEEAHGGWANTYIEVCKLSSQAAGHCCWGTMRAVMLLSLALLGSTCACSPSTSYEAGIVCRIAKSALLVCKCLPISVL